LMPNSTHNAKLAFDLIVMLSLSSVNF